MMVLLEYKYDSNYNYYFTHFKKSNSRGSKIHIVFICTTVSLIEMLLIVDKLVWTDILNEHFKENGEKLSMHFIWNKITRRYFTYCIIIA